MLYIDDLTENLNNGFTFFSVYTWGRQCLSCYAGLLRYHKGWILILKPGKIVDSLAHSFNHQSVMWLAYHFSMWKLWIRTVQVFDSKAYPLCAVTFTPQSPLTSTFLLKRRNSTLIYSIASWRNMPLVYYFSKRILWCIESSRCKL